MAFHLYFHHAADIGSENPEGLKNSLRQRGGGIASDVILFYFLKRVIVKNLLWAVWQSTAFEVL